MPASMLILSELFKIARYIAFIKIVQRTFQDIGAYAGPNKRLYAIGQLEVLLKKAEDFTPDQIDTEIEEIIATIDMVKAMLIDAATETKTFPFSLPLASLEQAAVDQYAMRWPDDPRHQDAAHSLYQPNDVVWHLSDGTWYVGPHSVGAGSPALDIPPVSTFDGTPFKPTA